MTDLDRRLLQALKRDGRRSISDLAIELKVTRSTVRAHMARLVNDGDIVGFTVLTARDVAQSAVRGLMMLGIEGRGTERILTALTRLPEVQRIHSTNGTWDLIAELETDTLEALDKALFKIRRMDGIARSETNLLLSTRGAVRP